LTADEFALQLEINRQRLRIAALEAAALHFLQASELGVSEAEGMRRAGALARLVGYEAGPQSPPKGLPEDFEELGRESARLASLLSEEIEVPGTDWAFALFLYREPRAGERSGHVLQISRSRDRTALAVARWLMDSHEAHQAKARG